MRTQQIESYEIVNRDGVSYLLYKLESERQPRMYALNLSQLGDISLKEYILCKEKTMRELMERCREGDK